jgi:hypothetical protein
MMKVSFDARRVRWRMGMIGVAGDIRHITLVLVGLALEQHDKRMKSCLPSHTAWLGEAGSDHFQ